VNKETRRQPPQHGSLLHLKGEKKKTKQGFGTPGASKKSKGRPSKCGQGKDWTFRSPVEHPGLQAGAPLQAGKPRPHKRLKKKGKT